MSTLLLFIWHDLCSAIQKLKYDYARSILNRIHGTATVQYRRTPARTYTEGWRWHIHVYSHYIYRKRCLFYNIIPNSIISTLNKSRRDRARETGDIQSISTFSAYSTSEIVLGTTMRTVMELFMCVYVVRVRVLFSFLFLIDSFHFSTGCQQCDGSFCFNSEEREHSTLHVLLFPLIRHFIDTKDPIRK